MTLEAIKASNDSQDIDTAKALEGHIAGLESQAKGLSDELGKSFATMKDAQTAHDNFVQNTYTTFAQQFADIKKQKLEALKKIEDASKTATSKEDKANLQKMQDKVNATARANVATLVFQIASKVLAVADQFADVYLGILMKGKIELSDIFAISADMLRMVADMIPNALAKAILGFVVGVIMFAKKIANFVETVRKRNKENADRAFNEEQKRQLELANKIAGESAKIYLKHIGLIRAGGESAKNVFDKMFSNMQDKAVQDALNDFGNHKTSQTKDVTYTTTKKEWHTNGYGISVYWDHEVQETRQEQKTINELQAEYRQAMIDGNEELAQIKADQILAERHAFLASRGIKEEELTALHKYYEGTFEIIENAYKRRDFSTLAVDFKNRLREAILKRLKDTMVEGKLQRLIDKILTMNGDGYHVEKAIKEIEKLGEAYKKEANRLLHYIGRIESEMDEHLREWSKMQESIRDALTSSLSDAAFNADWDGFKKAFASEMKKALLSAVVANAGLKTKIDKIVKNMMEDGKITDSEIDSAMHDLRNIYDELEGKMSPIAKLIGSLNGATVKHESQGSVIQKLSGEDRDWFTEIFKKMTESMQAVMIDLKEIHHAKITVLQATLNVDTVNINATDNMSLKEFLAELIEQARQAG